MNPDPVDIEIDRLERVLRAEDPDLAGRIRRLHHRRTVHVVGVFALLALGAVLLGAGFAFTAPLLFCAGASAYALAAILDRLLRLA